MKKSLFVEKACLSAEMAMEAVRTALNEGLERGISVSVAICGPSMELVAFAKGDAATPHSAETSRRKAQTSASTRRPTGWMPSNLAVELPMASGNLLTNIPGGTPVFIDGQFLGAIGIAGGTVDQDAAIAAAVLQVLGANQ